MEKLYTYQELATKFGVHEKTVSKWFCAWPKFESTRGHSVRIPESQLVKFLAERIRARRKAAGPVQKRTDKIQRELSQLTDLNEQISKKTDAGKGRGPTPAVRRAG